MTDSELMRLSEQVGLAGESHYRHRRKFRLV